MLLYNGSKLSKKKYIFFKNFELVSVHYRNNHTVYYIMTLCRLSRIIYSLHVNTRRVINRYT